jgi:hypothetical protein
MTEHHRELAAFHCSADYIPDAAFAVGIEVRPGKFEVSRHRRTKAAAQRDARALIRALREQPEIAKQFLAALAKTCPR